MNGDGILTLSEWLHYGEQRTPGVYEDVLNNRLVVRYRQGFAARGAALRKPLSARLRPLLSSTLNAEMWMPLF